jgi:hypothetical protein
MSLVGTPEHRGNTLLILGVDAPGANQPTIEIDDVLRFNEFTVMCASGTLKAFVSLDGTNFSSQVAWETMQQTAGQTRSLALGPGFVGYIRGQFKAIQIQQDGATGIQFAVLICGQAGRD